MHNKAGTSKRTVVLSLELLGDGGRNKLRKREVEEEDEEKMAAVRGRRCHISTKA